VISVLPGLLAAAAASLALNSSYVIQHSALATSPAVRLGRPIATIRALLKSRRWLSGAALSYGGLALNIVALALAPLALVQTVIAAGLIVVALGAARLHGGRLRPRDLAAVGLMTVAVAALSIGPAPGLIAGPPGALRTLAFGAAAIAVSACCVLTGSPGPSRPSRLGLAAGILYGATTLALAVLTSAPGIATSVAAIAVAAVTTSGGFFAFQRALQSGQPVPVVTLMTAGSNVVALTGALMVLGERLGNTTGLAIVHGAGFALVPLAAATAAAGLLVQPSKAARR